MATVDKYGYVRLRDDAHFYSVPHTCIGKKLQISYTSIDVEIWAGYDKVAHHTRDRHPFRHTTDPEHLCPKHRAIAEWSPETFISQAAAIHEDVEHYIRRVLEKVQYIDKANKYCAGILNFARSLRRHRIISGTTESIRVPGGTWPIAMASTASTKYRISSKISPKVSICPKRLPIYPSMKISAERSIISNGRYLLYHFLLVSR